MIDQLVKGIKKSRIQMFLRLVLDLFSYLLTYLFTYLLMYILTYLASRTRWGLKSGL